MKLTEIVHAQLADHLQTGDLAIDATAGNGHDTLFLAETVGADGRVITMDIQEDALAATRLRLTEKRLDDRVDFVLGDHARQLGDLAKTQPGSAAAVVFNLGYLPGGDKAIVTCWDNTERALDGAYRLLRPGGRLCVTAYCGHAGGAEEAAAVEAWMQAHAREGDFVESHLPDAKTQPPILWLLSKLSQGASRSGFQAPAGSSR